MSLKLYAVVLNQDEMRFMQALLDRCVAPIAEDIRAKWRAAREQQDKVAAA